MNRNVPPRSASCKVNKGTNQDSAGPLHRIVSPRMKIRVIMCLDYDKLSGDGNMRTEEERTEEYSGLADDHDDIPLVCGRSTSDRRQELASQDTLTSEAKR